MRGQWIQYSPEELEFIQENCTLPRAERYRVYQDEFHRPEVSQACPQVSKTSPRSKPGLAQK